MKNYRKILSILTALILALSVIAVPLSASAAVSDQAAVGEYIPSSTNGKVDPAYPDFEYTVANGEAKIINYNFNGSMVTFPSKLGGYTVTSIGDRQTGVFRLYKLDEREDPRFGHEYRTHGFL